MHSCIHTHTQTHAHIWTLNKLLLTFKWAWETLIEDSKNQHSNTNTHTHARVRAHTHTQGPSRISCILTWCICWIVKHADVYMSMRWWLLFAFRQRTWAELKMNFIVPEFSIVTLFICFRIQIVCTMIRGSCRALRTLNANGQCSTPTWFWMVFSAAN